jgi:CBS domain-containing protein
MDPDLTVREIMDREYVGASESDGLIETVALLLEEDKETAVVLRGSEHVGVLTERDVLSLLVEGPNPAEATVSDAMTEHVPTVSPQETVSAAADRLSTEPARRLVVTSGSEPLGVVTEEDLLAGRSYPTEQDEPLASVGEVPTGASGEATTRTEPNTDGFEEQGICEVCGSLTRDLASFNGQLLCAECRDM